MNKIKLLDIVTGTVTNAEGLALYLHLESNFNNDTKITISLEDVSSLSSSFMNSSFGTLVETYGLKKFSDTISFTRYTETHARLIKRYFAFYKETA